MNSYMFFMKKYRKENDSMKNILWGIFFVVFGLILGLNALDLTNINLFFDGWWTFFIILPCFIGLFVEEEKNINKN